MILDLIWGLLEHGAKVGESDLAVRSDRRLGICGLCLEMNISFGPYPSTYRRTIGDRRVISLVAFVVAMDYGVVNDCVGGYQAGVHEMAQVCHVLGWQNDPFSQKFQSLDDVCFCCLCEYLSDYVRASVSGADWVNEFVVSSLPATLMSLRQRGMGFVMMPVLTFCAEIEIQKDFDSSDVCLLASDGHFALASRSLACPTVHALCYALVPPLVNLEAVISMVSVCDLDSGRAVYRRGRR
jgi:hypothetical protein